jgi:hypothetical protein
MPITRQPCVGECSGVPPGHPITLLLVTSLPENEEEFVSMIRHVAGEVLASGRASLDVEPSDGPRPTLCELRPRNANACPVTVQLDFAEQVTLYFGRFGTICELYDGDRTRLLEDVGRFLEGVLAGKYRERVRLKDDELGRAKARLETSAGIVRFSYSRVGTIFRRGPWRELTYEPY